MTYCLALRLDAGLIFLSDTRTNAGVDNVGTYRKLQVLRPAPDRVFVVQSAGQPGDHPRDPGPGRSRPRHAGRAREPGHRVTPVRGRAVPRAVEQGGDGRALRHRRAGRQRHVHPRRPDRRRAPGHPPRLRGGQLHPGLRHDPVPPDRRGQVRQVPPRAGRAGARRPRRRRRRSRSARCSAPPTPTCRSVRPTTLGVYRNGSLEVHELRIEEGHPYLAQLNEVWIEQLLDSVRHLPKIPDDLMSDFW